MSVRGGESSLMDGETRYRRLAAMGIPLWLPRARLPGGPAGADTWKPVPPGASPGKPAVAPAAPRWEPPAAPVAVPAAKSESVEVRDPVPVAPPDPVPDPRPAADASAEADAEFLDEPLRLQVEFHWIGADDLLIVEAGEGPGMAQLRRDLLLAFEPGTDGEPARFQWPPGGREAMARRADLARDALGGFAAVRCEGREVRRIVICGELLRDWLQGADSPLREVTPGARLVVIPPLEGLVGNPSAKRTAWEILCNELHAG